MKKIVLIFTLIFSLSINSQVQIDINKSNIKWTGKEITTKEHFGALKFSKIDLKFDGDKITGGEFIVDMTSLDVQDLAGRGKERLEGHLRSDDFFSVEKHNKSKLTILSSKKIKNGYLVDGSLTIKEITHPIQFELISEAGGFVSNLVFDRSKYDVQYGSGSFFENLGDKLILDDIALSVNLYIKQMDVVD